MISNAFYLNGGIGLRDGSSQANAAGSALQLKRLYPSKPDGYYWIIPNNYSSASDAQYVWCDMTIDGGGWMLIARTHPNVSISNWGWRGGDNGTVNGFTAPYSLDIYNHFYLKGTKFDQIIYGNRGNINDNSWGPFIYKKYWASTSDNWMDTLYGSDIVMPALGRDLLKYDTSIYNNTNPNVGMQYNLGYSTSGTSIGVYYMRDTNSVAAYGIASSKMNTAYIGDSTYWLRSGPWGAGSSTDGSGNFIQATGSSTYGGTNQVMLMVR